MSNPSAVLLLVTLTVPVLVAQQVMRSVDQHIAEDRASSLYRHSVFAHGYIHGYEDGFRLGDIDLQTGHDARDFRRLKEFHAADSGYRRTFGNRDQFRAAYRKGFVAGYTDALADREFRAVAAARRASVGLPEIPDSGGDSNFDRGFRQGYESGQVHGELAVRDRVRYNSVPSACAPASPAPAGQPQDFCEGYARGYSIGYDDGYVASGPTIDRNTTAKKLR
jgi:hypothetical protein